MILASKHTLFDMPCQQGSDKELQIQNSYQNLKKGNENISSPLFNIISNNDFYTLTQFNSYKREADTKQNKKVLTTENTAS